MRDGENKNKGGFSSRTRITGSHSDIWDNDFIFEEDAPIEEDAPQKKVKEKSRLSQVERDIKTISFVSRNIQSLFFVACGILLVLILGSYFYIYRVSAIMRKELYENEVIFIKHKEDFKNFKDDVETRFIILEETSF